MTWPDAPHGSLSLPPEQSVIQPTRCLSDCSPPAAGNHSAGQMPPRHVPPMAGSHSAGQGAFAAADLPRLRKCAWNGPGQKQLNWTAAAGDAKHNASHVAPQAAIAAPTHCRHCCGTTQQLPWACMTSKDRKLQGCRKHEYAEAYISRLNDQLRQHFGGRQAMRNRRKPDKTCNCRLGQALKVGQA